MPYHPAYRMGVFVRLALQMVRNRELDFRAAIVPVRGYEEIAVLHRGEIAQEHLADDQPEAVPLLGHLVLLLLIDD